ncbi:nitronate monooxygenase family protein [Myxococcota bacterium]|nr:nitronate monooxygenase family protein [Myxococcota bacterium]
MYTTVRDMLGSEFPIFAFSHCRDVVAAVSKAGGVGVLGVVGYSPEQLQVELDWIEQEIGDRPYGVDILIPAKFVGKDKGGLDDGKLNELIPDEHRRFLEGLLAEHGISAAAEEVKSRGSMGFEQEKQRELIEVAFQHRIKLVANALGPPPDWMIERGHEEGVLVAALAGKAEHARNHAEAGVDIVVAQGYEAGGHTGEIATMVLIPEVVDAVHPVPVLAAGGIGNGRQIAAALSLGAQGVWTGSVWLTTEEAETHPVVKEKFLTATSSDTIRSRSRTGKPARQLRSAWTDAWEDPENPSPLPMPLQTQLVQKYWRRIENSAHKSIGAEQLINYFVGQVVGSMNDVRSVRSVVETMVQEYIDTMERLDRWASG